MRNVTRDSSFSSSESIGLSGAGVGLGELCFSDRNVLVETTLEGLDFASEMEFGWVLLPRPLEGGLISLLTCSKSSSRPRR